MALQTLDLQTVFMQMDNVGKDQSLLRDGTLIHQAIQGAESQAKVAEKMRGVNETQNLDEHGMKELRNEGHGKGAAAGKGNAGKRRGKDGEQPKKQVLTDPRLGARVDISG
jgi:hypothetical protein